jgi:hypothetical protein
MRDRGWSSKFNLDEVNEIGADVAKFDGVLSSVVGPSRAKMQEQYPSGNGEQK